MVVFIWEGNRGYKVVKARAERVDEIIIPQKRFYIYILSMS